MPNEGTSPELISLLNRAVAREMQVSIQYMLQHSIWNGREAIKAAEIVPKKHGKFIRDQCPAWTPGMPWTLKTIAITEMRHVGDVAERIVQLGGEPTTHPGPVSIGETFREMIEIDRDAEGGAIELYQQIINVAAAENDAITRNIFEQLLADETIHHRVFLELLKAL
jgi:bacterioferritin